MHMLITLTELRIYQYTYVSEGGISVLACILIFELFWRDYFGASLLPMSFFASK